MNAGQLVSKVILGKHDLRNLRKVVRLVLLNPEDLGSGKSGESDIAGKLGELSFSDLVIKIIGLSSGTSVVPKNSWTDNVVILIKDSNKISLTKKPAYIIII